MFKRFLALFKRGQQVDTPAVQRVDHTQFTRMTNEVYLDFAKRFPGPARPADAFEAGYLLGVQMVLQKLREGYVIGQG